MINHGKIKSDTGKQKDLLCSLIGIINIVKMAVLLKATDTLNAIPIKISMTFFTQIGKKKKKALKFIWKHKDPK
jgi:hypothetical protein